MKRYEMGFPKSEHPTIMMPSCINAVEHPEGEWVKWSDIEKLRSKLIEEFSINVAEGKRAWIKKLFSSLS